MFSVLLVLLADGVAGGTTAGAYSFSVCSGSGGAHGVDFRSHFATYATEYRIKGWVRNACNDCAYGMFEDSQEEKDEKGSAADELAALLRDPRRVVAELASKASNLTTNVTEIKAGSMMAGCPGSPVLPAAYGASAHVMVDWTFGKTCTDPCGCAPTDYHDCQQSTPLPAGAPYTKDCQRSPLGASTKNFPDCNSIRTHPLSTAACYGIDRGTIVPSGKCTGGWVGLTHAALSCCGPANAATGNRAGFTIPPAPVECSAFTTDDGYQNKCPSPGYSHPLE